MTRKHQIVAAALAVCAVAGWFLWPRRADDKELQASLDAITDRYRRIIVLMSGAETLPESEQARCRAAGRQIFWQKQEAFEDLRRRLEEDLRSGKGYLIRQTARYLSSAGLRDADKLAFFDLFEDLSEIAGPAASRNSLHDSVRATLEDLRSIQSGYREEVTKIFSQFATRGVAGTREKWEAYLRFLNGITTREKILAEYPDIVADEAEAITRGSRLNEIAGNDFAPKSVALTFDDGPHPKYTEQVTAILSKYGIRAAFFELGKNLGTVEKDDVKLATNADIARRLLAAGHVLANHTYSHKVLSKLPETERTTEIVKTNLLLQKVSGQKPVLFRPPFGARNQKIIEQVTGEGLQNVMWTVDSLDWADPVPESIALRVLHELTKTQKGIILFHDIHKQSVLALPAVLEELVRQNYTFLSFDQGKFLKTAPPVAPARAGTEVAAARATEMPRYTPYRQSWAVVIGINEYQHWPKLRYGVHDAQGIEEALVGKFGFRRENIIRLINGEATRQRIMQVLGDELTDPEKVKRDDRVFFFFAGHGATRSLPDGRQTGFIVPVDADRANYYSTAISMNAIREASDLIPAKHIYFVMDSCYSGLALNRGAGAFAKDHSYLEEVTRRTARQILTAGGAEQEVADDGPNGHSVFTWALLQGLEGKADLDGNGVITASELGAYVSPVVSSFSKQTPAVGNLVGSEGGEFIFELKPEVLTSMTEQLEGKELDLSAKLASLEKQVQSRQAELLRLQQSIQAETAKLQQIARSGQPPQAKPAIPKQARAYDLDRQARQLYREKKYAEAEAVLRQAVALKPKDATLLNNLGFVLFRMNRYADALTYLEKTLEVDPRRKEAHGNIADVYLQLGRKDDARKHYQDYLALYPASPRAGEVRGVLATLN